MTTLPWNSIVAAVCWVVLAVGALVWSRSAPHRRDHPAVEEPWEHVRERFPLQESLKAVPEVSEAWLAAVMRANPFSSKRRDAAAASVPNPSQPPPPPPPPPALFMYKGRVQMGSKERAVLEDATSKKTYFVEPSQKIAGFEVLEILEDRVVLSNLQTGEALTVQLSAKESAKSQKKDQPKAQGPSTKPQAPRPRF